MKKKDNKKRKVAAGAAATVTAASLLINNVVSDPEALLHSQAEQGSDASSHVLVIDGAEKRSYVVETDQYEPLTWREKATVWIQSMPLWVRAGILTPLWGIGEALNVLLSGLIHSVFGRFLIRLILEAALLTGLILLVWKLLFPNVPLKKILSKKNLPWILGAALVVTVADFVLGLVWDKWNVWRTILIALVGFGILILLWWRLFHKLPVPQPKKKKVELTVA